MNNRWLTVGLIVSIAVNLLFVGIAIGRSSDPAPWSRNVDPSFGFSQILRTLPEERRREIVRSANVRSARPPVRDMRRVQREANAAMVAEPFDADGLADVLMELRELMAESHLRSHTALVSIMARLTDEERRLVLAEMSRRGPVGARGAPRPPHERGPRGPGGRRGEPRGFPGDDGPRQRRPREGVPADAPPTPPADDTQ